jgi:hypothetical protein
MIDIAGYAVYPGVVDFWSAAYSCSHGVTPGMVVAATRIPPSPAPGGSLLLSDGLNSLTLRDCKLHHVDSDISDDGYVWRMEFLDRRWRWAFGAISGQYNTKDSRGILIPWRAKTPTELAELCLKAMGEKNYKIDMPKGTSAADLNQNPNLPPGEGAQKWGQNPEINWRDEVPAQALARLCDLFNRRLVFDPITDRVIIARAGDGGVLPANDFLDTVTDGVRLYERPSGIGVVGDKVVYQVRLKLIPVGREWDGRYLPIDQLSYAPTLPLLRGIWKITFSSAVTDLFSAVVTINGRPFSGGYTTAAGAASDLADKINNSPDIGRRMSATAVGGAITVEVFRNGEVIDIGATATGSATAGVTVECMQAPRGSPWECASVGEWWEVQATDRLSYDQARELAKQTVYRCFQVVSEDAETGWSGSTDYVGGGEPATPPKKITIPYYGEVDRRQNLELLPFKAELVRPEVVNNSLDSPIGSVAPSGDFYDGWVRNQRASVYGSHSKLCSGRWHYKDGRDNTPEGSKVMVPFVVDSENQMVIFSDGPLYKAVGGTAFTLYRAPNLVLETGVHVLDNKTFEPIRYRRWIELDQREKKGTPAEEAKKLVEFDPKNIGIREAKPINIKLPTRCENVGTKQKTPSGRVQWYGHDDDVNIVVIGKYRYDGKLDKHVLEGVEDDPYLKRSQQIADNYIIDHILEHQVEDGQTAGYFGIQPIPLDGAIMQVSWNIGEKTTTTASRNHTHGFATLPYPAKRKDENLAADADRAAANLKSKIINTAAAANIGVAGVIK